VTLTQLTPEGHQSFVALVPATPSAAAFGDVTYPIGAEADEPAVALVAGRRRLS
jgi:hypothetical protein